MASIRRRYRVVILGLALAAASCSKAPGDVQPLDVHLVMANALDPQADRFWAVGNAAFNEAGWMDQRRISPQEWARAEAAAHDMVETLNTLAQAPHLAVGAPASTGPDDLTPQQAKRVQALIQQDRPGFKALALGVAAFAREGELAAQNRNLRLFEQVSDELDGKCEQCHTRFWIPALSGN